MKLENKVAVITGAGSSWTGTGNSLFGFSGTAGLQIEDGGEFNTVGCYMGSNATGVCEARVSGPGSEMNSSGTLYLGLDGRGRLSVSDAGLVTAKNVSINSLSDATLHVSGDDMIVLGNAGTVGSITNNGTVKFWAGASLPEGVYRPISEFAGRAMTWSGSGTYNGFGGAWNDVDKTFTVDPATQGQMGLMYDVIIRHRLQFTDPGTGNSVGASFGVVPPGTTLLVSPLAAADVDDLGAMPDLVGEMLAGADFATNLTGQDVLLSFEVGAGKTDLAVWHLDGAGWTPYTPDLFVYDENGIVGFTASQFSGYAVVGVPEPASLTLLALGVLTLGVLTLARWHRKV